tara:strand:+ start:5377 stop:6630 length:1254 start_codon:yes stop_codon:yes gene_type:complete
MISAYTDRKNILEIFGIIIISSLPIIILLGSGILNFSIIILDLIFLIEIYRKKKFIYLKNNFFYSLIFIWFLLIFNCFITSIDTLASIPRTIGFLRFVLFIFALKYFFELENNLYQKKIFQFWSLTFIIITLDLIFEYIVGYNILGFKAELPGRLVGFMEDEMKIGHLYSAFILITLVSIDNFLRKITSLNNSKFLKNSIFYFFVIFFLITSFLIGERANFVRTFIIISIFILFYKKNFKTLLTIFTFSVLFFLYVISENERFKYRYWTTFIKPIIIEPSKGLFQPPYGNHYKVALEIFDNNKFFGVGLRNYAKESRKDIYSGHASIHPHQIHFEFLSELGILGYSVLFIFFLLTIFMGIKLFFMRKNYYQLSGILFVFVSLLPFIPSGSFFTTYGATLFWLNFSFLLKEINLNRSS